MSGWVLGIVGVVFLGVMVETIVPNGKTNVFIKSIFAIVFMYVVASPILKFVKNNDLIDLSAIFNVSDKDDELEQKLFEIKCQIENHLSDGGVEGVEVEVLGYSTNDDIIIEEISVNIANLVINKKDEHIDKYRLITDLIMEVVNVQEEKIVYG